MKDRIRQIMESHQMTQKTFSDFIGKSQGTISNIFTGRNRPTLDIIEAIKNKFPDVSTDWLLFGTGDMYKESTGSVKEPGLFDQDAPSPSPEEDLNFQHGMAERQSDILFTQGGNKTLQNQRTAQVIKLDKPSKRITEIRVFFDDQTWETFTPQK